MSDDLADDAIHEEWAVVPTASRYMVSTIGRVRSRVNRGNQIIESKPWRPVKTYLNSTGYMVFFVRRDDGSSKIMRVHRAMLEAFVGLPPYPSTLGRHLDDDRLNNRITNLAWGTLQDNVNDKIKNGVQPRGEKHGMAKLTKTDVLEIRRLHASKTVSRQELSESYNISITHVHQVVRRRCWKHI